MSTGTSTSGSYDSEGKLEIAEDLGLLSGKFDEGKNLVLSNN